MANDFQTARINKIYAIRKLEAAIANWQKVLDNPAAAEGHNLAKRTIAGNRKLIEEIKSASITDWN